MLRLFAEGADIHRATGGDFLGIPEDKVSEYNRSTGKTINFGRVFGSQGFSLMKLQWEDLSGNLKPITKDMIKRGFKRIDERFAGAASYPADVVTEINNNNGVYVSRFGRVRHLGVTLNDANKYSRENAERQAVNNSIQSPAASVTIRTLNAVNGFIESEIADGNMVEEDAYLILTVHDSGVWSVDESKAEMLAKKLRELASREIPELNNHRFKMKVGIGKSWTEAELNAR
jgi:DNA polymerase-1